MNGRNEREDEDREVGIRRVDRTRVTRKGTGERNEMRDGRTGIRW